MHRAALAAGLAVKLTAAGALVAQGTATGTVAGFAVDSIHNQPLRNAFVVLEGTAHGAASDSTGRFVIPAVPAGSYRAVLLHQLLDVLRIGVRTEPVSVSAGDTLRLFLGVPSAATVVRRRCEPTPSQPDSAALFGIVTHADGTPADGATVLLSWRQLIVSREEGVRESEQHRAAATHPDGTFVVCGLPDDLAADARAAQGDDTSGVVPVRIALTGLSVLELGLPEPGLATTANREPSAGTAAIRGRVIDRRREPVPLASVALHGGPVGYTTDSLGRFALTRLRAGSQTLAIRRVGYEMVELPLLLRKGQTIDLEVVLDAFVPLLAEVVVRARRDAALERVGFATRARAGSGFYINPQELESRHAARISDYLVEAPMLRVTGSGSNRRVTGRRGTGAGCVVYAVDGQRWSGPPPDEAFNPQEVGAIEVYGRGAAPALFLGINNCEVVLIWTKSYLGLRD